jgi:hypothetical protein
MAKRTLAAERDLNPADRDDQEKWALRLFEVAEHFENEFSENGLNNIRVEPKTGFH